MTTISITIPSLVLHGLLGIVASAAWFLIADRLLGRIWAKLARREGNIVLTSRYFWPALLCDGPIGWGLALAQVKHLRKERKDSWARRHDPETRSKIQDSIRKNREGWA